MSFENAYAAVSTFYLSASIQHATGEIDDAEYKRRAKEFHREKRFQYGRKTSLAAYLLFEHVHIIDETLSIINVYLGERFYAVAAWWVGFVYSEDFIERVNSLSHHKAIAALDLLER